MGEYRDRDNPLLSYITDFIYPIYLRCLHLYYLALPE